MKHESIKIGNTTYNIANGSCSLNDLTGYTAKVAIIIGSNNIKDMHKNLTENSTVIKYDEDGVEEWKQDNLVYTGRSTFDFSFPVGIEQVQAGVDDDEKPIYKYEEVKDSVIIVEYRTPTIQDEIQAQKAKIVSLNAQIAYLSMMNGIDVEGV
uniref:hypothetical protein n=1 Tax=Clostridium sp. NkU-1 TaxID=1095009 RepID=UPI0006D0D4CD